MTGVLTGEESPGNIPTILLVEDAQDLAPVLARELEANSYTR
jgi:hypothetical protein